MRQPLHAFTQARVCTLYSNELVWLLQNRELNLKVQKLQDELLRPKAAGALGSPEAGPLTYSMKKAQAKADEEAQAEIKKYKGLYDTGAKRIARFQQEVECQKIALERQEKQKKEVQGKVALLQDQLDSIQTRSVRSGLCTSILTSFPAHSVAARLVVALQWCIHAHTPTLHGWASLEHNS